MTNDSRDATSNPSVPFRADPEGTGDTRPAWLEDLLASIEPASPSHRAAAATRHGQLTKPAGSLGRLEDLGVQLAAIQRRERPRAERARVVIFAADHGVARDEGVSAFPCEVTGQMVANFAAGGAAVNALASSAGAELEVLDLGVAHPILTPEVRDRVRRFSLMAGTENFRRSPAMSRPQLEMALRIGIEAARRCAEDGIEVAAVGEMGIGNTSAASALTACLTGEAVADVTGPGTGLEDAGLRRKIAVLEDAIALHRGRELPPLELLRCLGGLEIAGLVGFFLGVAATRTICVNDGFICTAALAVAARVCPSVGDYVVAAHRSAEPGHRILLAALGLEPLLSLDMRLGEGSGAALALPLVRAAARVLDEMHTFADAGVSERDA